MLPMKPKLLFFNPYAGILEHLKIEKDLRRIINNSDMTIDFLRCDGLYDNFCTVMGALALTPNSSDKERRVACTKCKSLDTFSRDLKNSDYRSIDGLLTIAIKRQVSKMMLDVDIHNWMEYQFRGEYFGRIASYEFLLRNKLSSSKIPPELWPELRNEIELTLTTYLIARDYLQDSQYKLVGVYNFLYGMNRAFTIAAEQLNIETFSVQANGYIQNTHSRYLIYDTNSNYWNISSSKEWKKLKDYSISPREAFEVYGYFKALFRGKSVWTYSSPKSSLSREALRAHLGIPKDKNVALLTTSSADEQFAFTFVGLIDENFENSTSIFSNNLEWLESTIDIYKRNPEKFLVIRIHPREFANKREGVNSIEGLTLLNYLKRIQLPKNVIINNPMDNISIYDLASITEILINSTSTVGLEFAVLGIPSVTISPNKLTNYPIELSTPIHSKEEYEVVINSHLEKTNMLMAKIAFRWITFRYGDSTVSIPYRYLILDRFYFGPFMRFVNRFPKFRNFSVSSLSIIFRLIDFFDNRTFSKYELKLNSLEKSRNHSVEDFFIRLLLAFLNRTTRRF
jgi:hypothetical protein